MWANVWPTTQIVRINPSSGRVTATVDASGLLTPAQQEGTDVMNGITWLGGDEFLAHRQVLAGDAAGAVVRPDRSGRRGHARRAHGLPVRGVARPAACALKRPLRPGDGSEWTGAAPPIVPTPDGPIVGERRAVPALRRAGATPEGPATRHAGLPRRRDAAAPARGRSRRWTRTSPVAAIPGTTTRTTTRTPTAARRRRNPAAVDAVRTRARRRSWMPPTQATPPSWARPGQATPSSSTPSGPGGPRRRDPLPT